MQVFQDMLTGYESKILSSIGLILALYLIRIFLHRLITRGVENIKDRYFWRQTVNYIIFIGALALLIRLWFEWFQSIFTLLSLVAAATVVVSKELILNYVGYGIIIMRGLFDVGERIQIGQHTGDVMEIGPVYISLAEIGNWVHADEPTGRTLKIPNSVVLSQPLANYSRGSSVIWNELSIDLNPDCNYRKARAIALEVAEKHSLKFTKEIFSLIKKSLEDIKYTRTEPAVYMCIKEGKLELTIRYACKFHKRRISEQLIWDDLLQRFDEADDIHLASVKTSGEKA